MPESNPLTDKPHDYQPSWDYETITEEDNEQWEDIKQCRDVVDGAVIGIKRDVLPELEEIQTLEVHYGHLNPGMIATYVNGTRSWPVIVVDAHHILAEIEKNDIKDAVWMTLLHELGHAMQDILDREPDEEGAEEFARSIYDFDMIPEWAKSVSRKRAVYRTLR